MSLRFHPVFLIALVTTALALVLGIWGLWRRQGGARIMVVTFAVVLLVPGGCVLQVAYPTWFDARFRVYRGFYDDIQVGMTRQQVQERLARRYPPEGPRRRPKILQDDTEALGFFMDPEWSSEPNCEGIFLKMKEGRVLSKEYSAD